MATWALRVLLGLIFLLVGSEKLTGTGNTIDYFAAIGWGQWFRYLTGCLDISGAALLFFPRWTSYGAIVLVVSAGSAAFISLTILQGNATWSGPIMVAVPFILALLAATLAWIARRRPNVLTTPIKE